MDPTTNPTPTPNPAPEPGAAPAAPDAPATPPAPDAPAAPEAPAATPNPTPATAAGGITTPPVNPIINPAGAATNPAGAATAAQADGLAATDPIMMPEPAPEPDPVEEELKAPMKAAAPAPGSIGSAVSGPASDVPAEEGAAAPATNPFAKDDKQTPSVAFNDPAKQDDSAAKQGGDTVVPAKKKTNKTTLIALVIVAAMVVIALAAVLIMQLTSGSSTPASSGGSNANTAIDEPTNKTDNGGGNATNDQTVGEVLTCTRDMTSAEIAKLNNATSGTIEITAEFDSEDMLSQVSLVESVTYSDESTTSSEPVEGATQSATADELTVQDAETYYLPVKSGQLDLQKESIQTNYESLDFVCKAL